jgi:hypothetical protein
MKRVIKKKTDNAVVGIVTALLVISLITTFFAMVQLVYVPIIMEQREAEHMDKVAEQFGFLTSVIDKQAADGRTGIPIAAFITLGSKELPFLISSKAYGALEIIENSYIMNIQNDSINNIFRIGRITYSSTNAYYVDQSYTYEAGAMIVSQVSGNKMVVRPGFSLDYDRINKIANISFNIVNISSIGLKNIETGSGISGIQTEFRNLSTNINFTDVHNISIATPNTNAWFVYINHLLTESGLDSKADPAQYTLTKTEQALKLEFSSTLTVNMIFKIIDIQAQIGPGWVE